MTILQRIFCAGLIKENEQLVEDVRYYEARVESLSMTLSNAIELPDVSEYIEERFVVTPYTKVKEYGDFDIVCADIAYYAFPGDQWKRILTPIQAQVKKVLKEWQPEIADCDDFALLMNAFVVAAFANTDLDKQGAFSITWSGNHAYNSFISFESWDVYEPQTNEVRGFLGDTQEMYDSKMIWFSG